MKERNKERDILMLLDFLFYNFYNYIVQDAENWSLELSIWFIPVYGRFTLVYGRFTPVYVRFTPVYDRFTPVYSRFTLV